MKSRDAVADLRRLLPVSRGPGGRARESGVPELAYLRGKQAGQHEAYKALRKTFPRAAQFLLRQFSMTPNGDIRLW